MSDNSKCFAAICKNKKIFNTSASGGVFYVIASKVIEGGGVVYGAAYDEHMVVRHMPVYNQNDLKCLQSSKYVQSALGDVFKQIAKDLNNERQVLFSGTPCQIAGVKKFLAVYNKECMKNLLTIEVLCHGVPSPGIFRSYVEAQNTNKTDKLVGLDFKSKESKKAFTLKKLYASGKTKYSNALLDSYYAAFLADLTLRPSCYFCPFGGSNREADITLGDFWGIEKVNKELAKEPACSLVICNSSKGNSMLGNVKDELKLLPVSFEQATAKQPQIKYTQKKAKIPSKRAIVFEKWRTESTNAFFAFLLKESVQWKKVLFNSMPKCLRVLIKGVRR